MRQFCRPSDVRTVVHVSKRQNGIELVFEREAIPGITEVQYFVSTKKVNVFPVKKYPKLHILPRISAFTQCTSYRKSNPCIQLRESLNPAAKGLRQSPAWMARNYMSSGYQL